MSLFGRQDATALQEQMKKLKGSGFESAVNNEWKPKVGQDGSANFRFRFLPSASPDKTPFIKLVNHFINKVSNVMYINNCSSTFNDFENCPVCKYMNEHKTFDEDKDLYEKLKRQTSYYANVYVISDSQNPANNGKVMTYRFGKKIMDKIDDKLKADVSMGEKPLNAFCLVEGGDFMLKIKLKDKQVNYDDSYFMEPSVFGSAQGLDINTDVELQRTITDGIDANDIHSLVAPDQFKPMDKLTVEFERMMNGGKGTSDKHQKGGSIDDFDKQLGEFESGSGVAQAQAQTTKAPVKTTTTTKPKEPEFDDDVFTGDVGGDKVETKVTDTKSQNIDDILNGIL